MSIPQKPDTCNPTDGNSSDRKNEIEEIHGSNSNHMIDQLIRSRISLPEVGNVHVEINGGEASTSYPARRSVSPIRKWMSKLTTPDIDISESSTKPPPNSKENTLKAKLLEARSKGQRSRLKIFKSSS
uniref:Uncharacterized protein n=1 Tax=Rhizophora mucronata TaxID=61149 RepID=A0A2P2JIP3_RHIMU